MFVVRDFIYRGAEGMHVYGAKIYAFSSKEQGKAFVLDKIGELEYEERGGRFYIIDKEYKELLKERNQSWATRKGYALEEI